MNLEERVEKLEKRLAQYERYYGRDLDKKIKEAERGMEKLRLELTPNSELTEDEIMRKGINEHFEKQRQRLNEAYWKAKMPIMH